MAGAVVVVLDDVVLAGLTVPVASQFFFFLPLGVKHCVLAVLVLPLAFAELLLAAGIALPEGVEPVAGGVLDGEVGVLADAPPDALAEVPAEELSA